ncbi:cell division protein ZapE [Magnetospirillum sp. UT-4]|uniref:cell division protein ZapE n=1 Tax=Magnetospirillum sp. UT-4 TaxID=2681467 RepID=UPI00137C4EC4|nr:cell division protein ZapE [Magnetospirillum sp. UT-4]CAA7623846.1 Predicted ATPase [Magnetospirillum sp. UT-4]
MSDGPLFAYRELLASGALKPDPAQHLAAEKLQSLHKALAGYRPAMGETGWLKRFGFGARGRQGLDWTPGDAQTTAPRQGLYIYGDVGRGKSMLMDLFHAAATIPAKRRVHFHEFMRDIHAEIHRWRQAAHRAEADPIPKLARTIAAEAWLLCLDELQVTDIADAMIVGRLFEALLEDGVVVVLTSNRPPRDLYKDGLQRERFLPFIDLIERRFDLLELGSAQDYRLGRKRGLKVYHAPLGPQAEAALDHAFARLTEGAVPAPAAIAVNGRSVTVPLAAAGIARFDFRQLCATALGPSDYLELATLYHTLILSGVPLLGPDNKDEARRFVTLVDALYEHKVTLICSAAAPPEALYPTGIGAFEFQRTVSRLMEMQAEDYVTKGHVG